MLYSLLADLVVLIHLAFIVFVVAGGLLLLYSRRFLYLHLPAAAWGAFVELAGRTCPLTPLELSLRQKAGEEGYASSFIDHYLIPVLYPADLTLRVQVAAGVLVVVVNLVVYAAVLRRKRSKPPTATGEGCRP